MPGYRLSSEAESELDEIWLYIARASGSVEVASRVIDNITDCCWLLAQHPYFGRRRDHDLSPGLRSFSVDEYVIVHRIEADEVVLILHIMHGSRDISGLFAS